MGNALDKGTRDLSSVHLGSQLSGAQVYVAELRSLSQQPNPSAPSNLFYTFFSRVAEVLNKGNCPPAHKAALAQLLREGIGCAMSSPPLARSNEFLEPLGRFVYPSLILGLFERDVGLRKVLWGCLNDLNTRQAHRTWVPFVEAALTLFGKDDDPQAAAAANAAQVSAGLGSDPNPNPNAALGSGAGPLASSSSSTLASATSAQERETLAALLAAGQKILSESSVTEMTREAKIVVFFYVNLVKFEKRRPALLAPVLRALSEAIALGRVRDNGVFGPLIQTLSSVISTYGEADPFGVCAASFATMRAMLRERYGLLPAGKLRPGKEDQDLALVLVEAIKDKADLPFRTDALMVLNELLERHQFAELADAILGALLLVHEQIKTLVVRGGGDPAAVRLYLASTKCMQRILELPPVAAWRGPYFAQLVQWTCFGAVYFRGELRAGVNRCIAALYAAGKIGFVSDFAASYFVVFASLFDEHGIGAEHGPGLGAGVAGSAATSSAAAGRVSGAKGEVSLTLSTGNPSAATAAVAAADLKTLFASLAAFRLPSGWSLPRATVERGFISVVAIRPAAAAAAVDGIQHQQNQQQQAINQQQTISSALGSSSMARPAELPALEPGSAPGHAPLLSPGFAGAEPTVTTPSSSLRGSPDAVTMEHHKNLLEAGAESLLDVLLLLALESAGERRLIEAVLGIFGTAVYRAESPLLGDMFTSAVLNLACRLLEQQESRDVMVRDLEDRAAASERKVAELSRTCANLAAEGSATREKLRDLERDHEALQNSLACSICLEAFVARDPVALACGHIFCFECINEYAILKGNSKCCPQCRAAMTTPPLRLNGLG